MSDHKHFDTIEEFYLATRPDNIEELCSDLYCVVHPRLQRPEKAEGPESDSWRRSLPDLAELLYDLPAYLKRTAEESRALEDDLEKEILAVDALRLSPALASFTGSADLAEFEKAPGRAAVKKALDFELSSSLRSVEECFSALKKENLDKALESLKTQKEALEKNRQKLLAPAERIPLPGVSVDLERRLPAPSEDGAGERPAKAAGQPPRMDVLLKDEARGLYAIIELKQWTEDSMEVVTGEEDGEKRCFVRVTPYDKDSEHPAVKVRDVYKKRLLSEAAAGGKEAKVRCLVYLHNQFYDGGQLFRAREQGVDIYDGKGQGNNILFTRMRCRSMAEAVASFFKQ
ncbi:MAG: hypothetical protein II499_04695 [Firmicutes bacterium]|nr:hypothetical protein [Bacillota bacterium]